MYSHHQNNLHNNSNNYHVNNSNKRLFHSRKDDPGPYRIASSEFPSHTTNSHYYSSSSLYSYSPTSSNSDYNCREHGGSSNISSKGHRRTRIILTFSVVFATLGVLSIAGIAGYLGFLSKHIYPSSNSQSNAESLEPPFGGIHLDDSLQTQTSSSSSSTSDLIFYNPNPRSKSNHNHNGPADDVEITNSLDSNFGRADPDLLDMKIIRKPINTTPQTYRTTTTTTSTTKGTTTTRRPNPTTPKSKPIPTSRSPVLGHGTATRTAPEDLTLTNIHVSNHRSTEDEFIPMKVVPTHLPSHTLLQTHLKFDRISPPELYDQEPWTPLIIGPNLGKRPRVEVIVPPTEVQKSTKTTTKTTTSTSTTTTTTTPVPQPLPPVPVKPLDIEAYTLIQIPINDPAPPKTRLGMEESLVQLGSPKTGIQDKDLLLDEEDEEDDDEEEDDEENLRGGGGGLGIVYELDPNNTDMVPKDDGELNRDRVGVELDLMAASKRDEEQEVEEQSPDPPGPPPQMTPKNISATTDYILNTLGSLSLVKTASPGDFEGGTNHSNNNTQGTDAPLFPPIRSYVGVNLPLRPKPEDSESDESSDNSNHSSSSAEDLFLLQHPHDSHNLKLVDAEGTPVVLQSPTATSSLSKVLSMMMSFDGSTGPGETRNLTLPNSGVKLVVGNNGTIGSREQKSIYRDPKIDSRFKNEDSNNHNHHIPVPLLVYPQSPNRPHRPNNKIYRDPKEQQQQHLTDQNSTNRPSRPWSATKLSSITINSNNSPVYKFVLRKGQSVEDLLREIFTNYTQKGTKIGIMRDESDFTTAPTVPTTILPVSITTTTPKPTTTSTTTTAPTTAVPTTTSTSIPLFAGIKTSTSITVNEIGLGPQVSVTTNGTFRCLTSGIQLSAFTRCNGIKDCPDNSDEQGCLCVDFLRAQMLHRKICDGIPDCKDFSDENQCEWCRPGQYICAGSRACVNRDKICDGRRDCPRGDDESDCVKIGQSGLTDELEDLSPTYQRTGYLMVRKKGIWGKLCVETFNTVLSHWEVKDLARAVCKAKTFSDFESVEKVVDDEWGEYPNEPYYELYNGANDTEQSPYSSSESTPRSTIGFQISECKTRVVVRVTCQDLQCGTAPRAFTQAARIVGGSNALPGEWPWQAALYRDGEYQCGATLISSRWLLSAGHCFYHAQDDYWVARLGTLRRGATVLSPYEQVIRITHIFLHPQYKDIGFVNDVSLLRLEREVNFTDFVRPVCLPGKDTEIRDGRICTVVGWGQLFETGRVFPDTLQEVQLPLISTGECRKRTLFLPLYKLTDEMFCAGFDRGGRDACLGDSGGPLMCPEGDGRWSLYGVTSNGYGCARANRPGVYTKTKSYIDWVQSKMSQDDNYGFSYRDKTKPCLGHRCLLGECLESKRICNGFRDCLDGSDERNCTWS